MTDEYRFLHYDVSGGIASIELDRPPVNAIHEAMTDEYFDALARADQDDAVKVLILSGRGKGLLRRRRSPISGGIRHTGNG